MNKTGKGLIGLISAVFSEGENIIRNVRHVKKSGIKNALFYGGKIHGKDIVYISSGLGKTNAAHAATLLILKRNPSLIINFGIGGTYPSSGLNVGDIAVATKEIYGDEGFITDKGFFGIESIGIPLLKRGRKKYFNEFVFDKKLIKRVLNLINTGKVQIKAGPFITLSTCTGIKKKAVELEKKYGALCENMEGAAIAHICAVYGIPVLEIRGISNIVEDRNKKKWDIRQASENCQDTLIDLISRI